MNCAEKRYSLKLVRTSDEQIIKNLYNWSEKETMNDRFTCRPIREIVSYSKYKENFLKIIEKGIYTYVLASKNDILGKITLFDYNKRNHSAEFGFYLPEENRSKGFGKIMTSAFLEKVFSNTDLDLHKVYATTASGNKPSQKILNFFGFKLDGVMRDHYWFKSEKQDQLIYSLLKNEWLKIQNKMDNIYEN